MYQFITGIAFEITLIIFFTAGYLLIDGRIKFKNDSKELADWRIKNGRVIKFICIMTIIVLICSIIAKYFQYTSPVMPSLER